jgi:hypothetical protein
MLGKWTLEIGHTQVSTKIIGKWKLEIGDAADNSLHKSK